MLEIKDKDNYFLINTKNHTYHTHKDDIDKYYRDECQKHLDALKRNCTLDKHDVAKILTTTAELIIIARIKATNSFSEAHTLMCLVKDMAKETLKGVKA